MTKHTAGPWAVTGGQTVHQPNKDHYKPICKAYGKYHKDADKSEAEANARLIAAAPELLDALKLALKQNECDMVMTGEECRKASKAIAKAEQP